MRRFRRLPRAVPLLALLGAGAAIAGCGSTQASSPVSGAAAIKRAAYVSSGASGYTVRMQIQESSSALGGTLRGSGTGAFSVAGHGGSMSLTMTLPGAAAAIGPLQVREVVLPGKVFVMLPAVIASKLPGHKPWIEVNLAQAAKSSGLQNLSALTGGPGSSDPGQFLQVLRATSPGGVRTLGTQVIDGRRATHYEGRIDLSRAPSLVPGSQRAGVRQAIQSLERLSGLRTLPVNVWIDSQHLVRRLMISFSTSASGQTSVIRLRMDFPSYGPESVPSAPPAGKVTNITSALSSGSGASAF